MVGDEVRTAETTPTKSTIDSPRPRRYHYWLRVSSAEEEEKLLKGVLNQVNAFVEEYAAEEGFDLVLGTTLSGSILYGTTGIDITEQVLQAMNQQYSGYDEQVQ